MPGEINQALMFLSDVRNEENELLISGIINQHSTLCHVGPHLIVFLEKGSFIESVTKGITFL